MLRSAVHISFHVKLICLIDEFDDGCGSIVIHFHSHSSLNLITLHIQINEQNTTETERYQKSLRYYYFQLYHNNIVSVKQSDFFDIFFQIFGSLYRFHCNHFAKATVLILISVVHCADIAFEISEQLHLKLFNLNDIGQMKTKTAVAAAAAATIYKHR